MTTKDHQMQITKSTFPIILPAGIPNGPIDNIGCIPKVQNSTSNHDRSSPLFLGHLKQ